MGIIEDDTPKRRRLGLVYDDRMCKHSDPDHNEHPENPGRVRAIWEHLNVSGLAQRCVVLDGKKAYDSHLALVHSKEHIKFIKTISSSDPVTRRRAASKLDSIYFNEASSEASYLAAGSVIKAAEEVGKGKLEYAFAIVRPPGHHAEHDEAKGFCNYNNVAIAASFLLNKRPQFGISKILIVDWDVHHGNGTQKMFYKDPRVLVFSVHRHDYGRFYPYGDDGSYNMIGEGPGAGYNINIPWENGGCGDADYFAVWDQILIPVAKEFNPDIIMISAGFDAALGDPIGGCCLSPYGYAIMLDKLMDIGRGKIVMALEGGYDPVSLASSVQACVEVFLQDRPSIRSCNGLPLKSTELVIQAVRQALSKYWSVLGAKLPDKVINSRPSQTEDIVDASSPSVQAISNVEPVHVADKQIVPQLKTGGTHMFFRCNRSAKTSPQRATHEVVAAKAQVASASSKKRAPSTSKAQVAPPLKKKKDFSATKKKGISGDPSELNPKCLAEGYTPIVPPVLPGFHLTNCESLSEMEELAKVMDIPDKSETSAASADHQLSILVQTKALVSELYQLQSKIDYSVLKTCLAAAAEHSEETEMLKHEKPNLQDGLVSFRVKYEELLQASEGKDRVIAILRSQVEQHKSEATRLREEVEVARRQGQEEGRREGIVLGTVKGYKAAQYVKGYKAAQDPALADSAELRTLMEDFRAKVFL